VVLSRQENFNPNPEEVGPGGDAGGALVAKSVEVKELYLYMYLGGGGKVLPHQIFLSLSSPIFLDLEIFTKELFLI
jgi:hypothetical protein